MNHILPHAQRSRKCHLHVHLHLLPGAAWRYAAFVTCDRTCICKVKFEPFPAQE